MKEKFTVIDLFSGIGGIHMGFSNKNFEVVLAIDNDPDVQNTHSRNFPGIPFLWKKMEDVKLDEINKLLKGKKVNVVVGGPPCQGFSMVGKRNIDDSRNKLFRQFLVIVNHLRPDYFLMENVKGLLTMDGGSVKDKIIEEFSKIGYQIDYKWLDAADYGVPQFRERVFFFGNKFGEKVDFPKPTHCENPAEQLIPGLKRYVNVGEALKGISSKDPNHVPMHHNPLVVERLSYIPEGGKLELDKLPKHLKFGSRSDFKKKRINNFANVFRRLNRKRPSITMVPGHNAFPVHPTENRTLTVREAARIQTIPDKVIITGSRQEQCIQVGNAVPVKLAQAWASHIKKKLKKHYKK